MAFEPSFSKDAAVGDSTFLGQTWEVVEKVFAAGMVEILFFAATVIIAMLMRSTHGVGRGAGGAKKNKDIRRVVMPSVPRVSAPNFPSTNTVAQLADDSISMRCSTSKVLSRYAELKADGKLSNIEKELAAASSPHTVSTFYQSLVQCACRGTQPELVAILLDDMEAIGCARSIGFYESAMRLLAAKKCFKEALAVNDRLERDGLTASAVTQSCLVSFSAELGLNDKTIYFFERLCEIGPPSVRACMVVLRVHAAKQDWPASIARLRSMFDIGVEVDGLCLNIVLATGVAVGKVDEAEAFLSEAGVARIADTISYNTILKGLAQKGSVDAASRLFDSMEKQGVLANLITFNTLIDAAVRARKIDQAWRLYDQMRQSTALKPDKCTCSTLVKALQHRPTPEQVERVLELVDGVIHGCQQDLAGRLLNGILYASLRITDLRLALRTKSKIVELGFTLTEADVRCIAQLQMRSQPSGF